MKPRTENERPFAEPWQAQVFALAVRLVETGHFTWTEWTAALAAELAGDPGDDGSRYYQHWLAALERLVTGKALCGQDDLAARKQDWIEAYLRTPHGQPVELPPRR